MCTLEVLANPSSPRASALPAGLMGLCGLGSRGLGALVVPSGLGTRPSSFGPRDIVHSKWAVLSFGSGPSFFLTVSATEVDLALHFIRPQLEQN